MWAFLIFFFSTRLIRINCIYLIISGSLYQHPREIIHQAARLKSSADKRGKVMLELKQVSVCSGCSNPQLSPNYTNCNSIWSAQFLTVNRNDVRMMYWLRFSPGSPCKYALLCCVSVIMRARDLWAYNWVLMKITEVEVASWSMSSDE